MRIGNNEKIIFSLLKNYPDLSRNDLQVLFTLITHKQARVDLIINSLKRKELIDEQTCAVDYSEIDEELFPNVQIPKKILDNVRHLDEPVKLGKTAKSILYVLYQTKKSSLQFLAKFFKIPIRNTYAILKRLEEKNLVISYNSRIRHVNTLGRHYNPKYYVLTDLGQLWLQIKLDGTINTKHIDKLLEKPQNEIKIMVSNFQYN